MSTLSGFWTTSGAPAGDQQASYSQSHWSTASAVMTGCNGFEGVAAGYLNSLAGTVTGANTASINTGGAMVDGKWFVNNAALPVTIISAVGGGNTRIDRIVLRCDWAGFAVTIHRIAGTDAGIPSAPAIVQTPGTTYDIMLYQAHVDTGGTVTLTDERVFARGSIVAYHQGADDTDWVGQGVNNFAVSNSIIQVGAAHWAGASDGDGYVDITFPVAFSKWPLVFAVSPMLGVVCAAELVDLVSFRSYWISAVGGDRTSVTMNWLAMGPV